MMDMRAAWAVGFWAAGIILSACLGPARPLGSVPTVPPDPVSAADLHRPLENARIISPFGKRGRRFHRGIDLKASRTGGEPVRAAAAGRVVQIRKRGTYGKMVLLRHENGYLTRYAHLRTVHVRRDEPVKVGQPVGTVGATGRATSPHLHFELLTPEWKLLDPYPFLFGNIPE